MSDNVSKVSYSCSMEFIENIRMINYQHIQKDNFLLWQEETLLEMLLVSLEKDKLLSLWLSGNSVVPDFTFWDSQFLLKIK